MEVRVSSTSPRQNTGVISNTTKGHFTQLNIVWNDICSIKILRTSILIFVYRLYSHTVYSNSVYISGKLLSAECGIVQLNASPGCIVNWQIWYANFETLFHLSFIAEIWVNVTNVSSWLIPWENTFPMIPGDAIKCMISHSELLYWPICTWCPIKRGIGKESRPRSRCHRSRCLIRVYSTLFANR